MRKRWRCKRKIAHIKEIFLLILIIGGSCLFWGSIFSSVYDWRIFEWLNGLFKFMGLRRF